MTAVKTQGFLLSMAGSTVMQMAFSPDGLWLVAAGSDGVARLWDTATGDELQRFSGHTSRLNSATFSINGVLLLTTSADNTARLWYTQSGELLRVFGGHTGEVIGGAIAPDSFSVTTGGIDRTIRVWDSQYDAAFRRWGNLPGRPSALQFSPDGKRFLVGGSGSQGDGFASVWDTQDGTRLLNLDISYARASEVREALFSPDGTKIGLLGKNQLFVFDAQSGLPLSQMTGKFKTGGLALAFSPDSRSLLVSDATETLVIDPQTNTITKRLPGISGESLILSHDGAFILGLTIGSAAMWNLATGAKIRAFSGAKGAMESFSLSQDGRYLLTGQTDINKQPEANVALLWDVNSARIVRGFVGHSGGVQAVAISPDGRYALTGSVDRTVRLWDVATGTELRELTGHTDSIVSVAFSPDGKYMLTGSDDLTVRLWDTDYRDTLQLACQRLQRDLTQAEQTRFRIPNHRKTC